MKRWLFLVIALLPSLLRGGDFSPSQVLYPGAIFSNPATALVYPNQLQTRFQVFHLNYLDDAWGLRRGRFAYSLPLRFPGWSVGGSFFDAGILYRSRLNLGWARRWWGRIHLGARLGWEYEGFRRDRFQGFDFADPVFAHDDFGHGLWHLDLTATLFPLPGWVVALGLYDANYPRIGLQEKIHAPVRYSLSTAWRTRWLDLCLDFNNQDLNTVPDGFGDSFSAPQYHLEMLVEPLSGFHLGLGYAPGVFDARVLLKGENLTYEYNFDLPLNALGEAGSGSHLVGLAWSFENRTSTSEPREFRRLIKALERNSTPASALEYSLHHRPAAELQEAPVPRPDPPELPATLFAAASESLFVEHRILHLTEDLLRLPPHLFAEARKSGESAHWEEELSRLVTYHHGYLQTLQALSFSPVAVEIVADPGNLDRAGMIRELINSRHPERTVDLRITSGEEKGGLKLEKTVLSADTLYLRHALLRPPDGELREVRIRLAAGSGEEVTVAANPEDAGLVKIPWRDYPRLWRNPGFVRVSLEYSFAENITLKTDTILIRVFQRRRSENYSRLAGGPVDLQSYDKVTIYLIDSNP